jgi:hypothetical protein
MSNLDIIKQKLQDAGFYSFEDWSFDFTKQGGKTINYYAKATSESGQIKEKGLFFDHAEFDGMLPEEGMEKFRKYLLDNISEFIG